MFCQWPEIHYRSLEDDGLVFVCLIFKLFVCFSLLAALKPPYKLFFRVKFYAVDPSTLHEEITRCVIQVNDNWNCIFCNPFHKMKIWQGKLGNKTVKFFGRWPPRTWRWKIIGVLSLQLPQVTKIIFFCTISIPYQADKGVGVKCLSVLKHFPHFLRSDLLKWNNSSIC